MIPGAVLAFLEGEGCTVHAGLAPPRPTPESIAKCRGYCEDDRCGNYATNWGCPPYVGGPDECLDLCYSYGTCLVAAIPLRCGFDDEEGLRSETDRSQTIGREVKRLFLADGVDALVLADGPCRLCERCTALDGTPCPFPEKMIPSASGFGITVNDYLESVGVEIDPDAPCLYCFALTKSCTQG